MLGYLNYINITDGQHSVKIQNANRITIHSANGEITQVLTGNFDTGKPCNNNYTCDTFLLGYETKKRNRLVERLHYGKEYRNADLHIPYSAKTWQSIHGIVKRREELFKTPCVVHTEFKRGRFIKQSAYWQNGVRAYQFNRGDTEVKAVYPKGTLAIEVKRIEVDYKGSWDTKELLRLGYPIFETKRRGESLFGDNYSFIQYDRRKRVKNKGAFKNNQRYGKWIIDYKKQAYLSGVMVDEDLIDAKPEDIAVSRVLKINNAQVRAMLIDKIGIKRLCQELKAKTIDACVDKSGNPMRLLELPLKADDGNGHSDGSRLRVLDVICPSTNNHYFLGVPDRVWQGGDRLEINTCELAKQLGFQDKDNEITEELEFVRET